MSAMPDGYYPRATGKQITSGQYNESMVSLVGEMQDTDGERMTLRACDNEVITCMISPDIDFESGKMCEIIGATNGNGGIEAFVSRDLGRDFDLSLYHDLLTQVMYSGGKFGSYFNLE